MGKKRVGRLAKFRESVVAQLWRGNKFTVLWCPDHGKQKVAVLPPLACPSCELERKYPPMLRRPSPKRNIGKVSRDKCP